MSINLSEISYFSRIRHHLPKLGFLILIALLCLDFHHRDWDFSRPSFVKGSYEFYLMALICMAIGPGYTIGVYLYFKDKFFDESWSLLGKLFLFGALSGPVAGLGEGILQHLFQYNPKTSSTAEHLIFMFFVVALWEESAKYIVAKKIGYSTDRFKQVYDGILFCSASALGFATAENIIYVFTAGTDAMGVALARSLTSIPSHISDAVVMGYGMGKAKEMDGSPKEKEWLALGLGGAILLHGTYDFLLVIDTGLWKLPLFLLVMLGGWFVAYKVMKKGLAYTPFAHCSKCRQVIPQMVSFCPFCGKEHSIVLKCWNCGVAVTKWTRRCSRCSVRMKFPWHLQSRRINDLYHNREFSSCRSCEEEIPVGMGFCLHCGKEAGTLKGK